MRKLGFKIYLSVSLTMLSAIIAQGNISVSLDVTGDKVPIEITPEKSTGLDKIYVAYNSNDIKSLVLTGNGEIIVEKYGNLGGGYAEPVSVSHTGTEYRVENPQGDAGYIIKDNDRAYYIWIVDYQQHFFSISSLSANDVQDCDNTTLQAIATADAIHYYTIDGRPVELSRDIELSYNNARWDEENEMFVTESVTKVLPSFGSHITITPPLYISSYFSVTGDRFLRTWGMVRNCDSEIIMPNGLKAETTAVRTNLPEESEDGPASNIIKGDGDDGLGGSAPADITFTAYTTAAVIHDEWQISRDESFGNILYRFTEREVDYTFYDEGVYYARYVGSNADGSCDVYGPTYTISIGASDLRIPNAFSPNDDGVNDIWKVGYRSLVNFRCSIFDRYGNELYRFDDPSGGWDGKVRGKTVKPGVYFYVLEAEGTDGKKYKKGGDINVVGYKKIGSNVAAD